MNVPEYNLSFFDDFSWKNHKNLLKLPYNLKFTVKDFHLISKEEIEERFLKAFYILNSIQDTKPVIYINNYEAGCLFKLYPMIEKDDLRVLNEMFICNFDKHLPKFSKEQFNAIKAICNRLVKIWCTEYSLELKINVCDQVYNVFPLFTEDHKEKSFFRTISINLMLFLARYPNIYVTRKSQLSLLNSFKKENKCHVWIKLIDTSSKYGNVLLVKSSNCILFFKEGWDHVECWQRIAQYSIILVVGVDLLDNEEFYKKFLKFSKFFHEIYFCDCTEEYLEKVDKFV